MLDPKGLREFLTLATGKGVRSTVLIDLRWLCGLLIAAFAYAAVRGAATWVCVALLILMCIAVGTYIAAWIFFAKKNVNLLRSEHYLLRQQELQLLGGKKLPEFVDVPSGRIDAPTDVGELTARRPAIENDQDSEQEHA